MTQTPIRVDTARQVAIQPRVSHLDVAGLLARVMRERHGFFLDTDVALLAADPAGRLQPCLVRCGSCRFTCPAQDVAHLIACIEAGGDYVRDVSIPAGRQS